MRSSINNGVRVRHPFAILRTALLAAALGVALAPGAAAADDAAAAAKQFASAQKLYEAGKYADALPLFQETVKATGSPNARLYVARCLRELGRLPEAFEEMSLTLREASSRAEKEGKYAQTRDAAAAELALLERRVGRIIIAIANAPPDVKVKLDDAQVDPSRVGEPIAVDPGTRAVTVSSPTGAVLRRDVDVAAGETKTLALALPGDGPRSDSSSKDTGTTTTTTPDTGETSGGGVRVAGFAVVGLGVAGMALFGVATAMAESKFSTLETECGGARCTDSKYADTVDSGKTMDLLANIGLISGASCLAIGGAMIIFGGPSAKEPTTTGMITVSPAGVRGTVVF